MPAPQSILQGSNHLHQVDLGLFRVTSAYFPPHLKLPFHFHPRPCLALVLLGQVKKQFSRRTVELGRQLGCTMPPEERHGDHFSLEGAHMLVIEPAVTREAAKLFEPCQQLMSEVSYIADFELMARARELSREVVSQDPFSRLVINGLALEMMGMASREHKLRPFAAPVPNWLVQAQAYLHDHFWFDHSHRSSRGGCRRPPRSHGAHVPAPFQSVAGGICPSNKSQMGKSADSRPTAFTGRFGPGGGLRRSESYDASV